ncbi:MAG: hypothetical protein WKG07_41205 [Hymenobacter sp.]
MEGTPVYALTPQAAGRAGGGRPYPLLAPEPKARPAARRAAGAGWRGGGLGTSLPHFLAEAPKLKNPAPTLLRELAGPTPPDLAEALTALPIPGGGPQASWPRRSRRRAACHWPRWMKTRCAAPPARYLPGRRNAGLGKRLPGAVCRKAASASGAWAARSVMAQRLATGPGQTQ